MGGGDGYGFDRRQGTVWQPADLEQSLAQTRQQAQKAEVARMFQDALAQINQIDTKALNRHKEEIFQALKTAYEEADDLRGGGSYSQHTYVDGISDIDMLFVLGAFSSSKIPNKESSKVVLADMEKRLRQRFPTTDIKSGRMAATLTFSDGLELQVLPAFRYHSGFRIPDYRGSGWVEARPHVFNKLLQQRNKEMGGQLIPCIKLAKQICKNQGVEVKSYHLSNMAVKAFEQYTGTKSHEDMLRHFFNKAKELTATRMKDVTGQGSYVDNHLAGKTQRIALAQQLGAIEQQIARAEGKASEWQKLLQLPD
jgi:hypothetical protein